MNPRWLFVVLIGLTLACRSSRGPDRPSEEDWTNARNLAEQWAVGIAGADASVIGEPVKALPFMFETIASQTGVVLVHRGGVWTDTGLNEVATYLHDAGIYRYEGLTQRELLLLLRHFKALPPISSREGTPEGYHAGEGALGPTFAWNDHKMELTLRYELKERSGTNVMISEWALVLGQGVQPRWREERRPFDPDHQRFVR